MNYARLLACGIALASLCACGGGGGGIFGNNPYFGGSGAACNTGTAVQLARPNPGSYAPNTNTIEVVVSGNSNYVSESPANWYVYVTNNYGQTFQGGSLNATPDPNGPHPFSSDFYYNSSLNTTLPSGYNWTVWLSQYNGNCAVQLQGFST